MKNFKVTIYPQTAWVMNVEAENEEEAKTKALDAEGPIDYAFAEDLDEWHPEIWAWPNIGVNGQVDVEEQ